MSDLHPKNGSEAPRLTRASQMLEVDRRIVGEHVERERRRERLPANFGKPWTQGEDEALTGEFDGGMAMAEIARRHARTQSSIRLRLEKLGKIEPAPAQ